MPEDSDMDMRKYVEELESLFSTLRVEYVTVPSYFDVLKAIDERADINFVLLAPPRSHNCAVAPVIQELIRMKNVEVLFEWYEDAPSREEDFVERMKKIITTYAG